MVFATKTPCRPVNCLDVVGWIVVVLLLAGVSSTE
jgi:hypothetical protein